jgi:putative PIN family toxin of toxin-antitoxin system
VIRVVIDTNILVAACYKPGSDSAWILRACRDGRFQAVLGPELWGEQVFILPRATREGERAGRLLAELRELALWVEPREIPAIVRGDPSDDMLFATAVAGGAGVIVTSDRRLWSYDGTQGVRVLPPGRFRQQVGEGPGD